MCKNGNSDAHSDGTGETLGKMEMAQELWPHLQTILEPKNDAQTYAQEWKYLFM